MSDKMSDQKNDQIEGYISLRHPQERGEWALFFEFVPGTGSSLTSGRRWDALAVSCWGTTKGHRISYEVKRSRSDFLRELANREKRDLAERLCHETWFCVHSGICTVEEVPEGWGLMIVNPENGAVHYPRAARTRNTVETPDSFVAALARRAGEDGEKCRTIPRGIWKLAGTEVAEKDLYDFCQVLMPRVVLGIIEEGIRSEKARANRYQAVYSELLTHFGHEPTNWDVRKLIQTANKKVTGISPIVSRLRDLADEFENEYRSLNS